MMNCTEFNRIIPTDVRVYVEDKVPYLDYYGITWFGRDKVRVHFPKISLALSNVAYTAEDRQQTLEIGSEHTFSPSETVFTVEILERNMTKAQVEKELGYKVNIIDK